MQNKLILCPTARLVRAIKSDIAKAKLQAGHTQWQSPQVLTLTKWLDLLTETCLLSGKIQKPPLHLSAFNEQLLWEEVIQKSLNTNAFGTLFNVSGLANAAIEANKYCIAWHLNIPRDSLTEETRQFVKWQQAFQKRCEMLGVLEDVRYIDWQLELIRNNALETSIHEFSGGIIFAGFDQTAPQEDRLRDLLKAHGIEITEYANKLATPAHAQHISLENIEAECRAAAAWAKQQLDQNPSTTIAIIAPQLSAVRNQLADLLDDTLCPASARPALFDITRPYNFSLGTPLIEQPMIQAALNLLRLFSSYHMPQTEISKILLSPFWSNYAKEADGRAQLDAHMREKAASQLSLDSLIVIAKNQLKYGIIINHLIQDLKTASTYISNKKATPSAWAQSFTKLLNYLQWPRAGNINSLEFQTEKAWQKALQQLSALDALDSLVSMSEATSLMHQICEAQVFQPETAHNTPIQVLGIMEDLSAPVDAIWVLQMNDHIWPPPTRPNALLPSHIQRAARLPNSDSSTQSSFALGIHQRVLHSTKMVIFSSSQLENTSQLRPSPLIKNVEAISNFSLVQTLAEKLSKIGNQDLTHIDDHMAPAVQAGDHVSGGTGLFRAQAICPAWAFYQYRLGAKSLKTPSDGLDNLARGQLVHAVLAAFWQPNNQKRHFADLRNMSNASLDTHLNKAIQSSLDEFARSTNIATQTLLELEHERLYKLVSAWLAFEKEQGIAFHIIGCELEKQVDINDIEVTLKIDRIHQLEDGGMVFVDYKTGQVPKTGTWGEDRIAEPQLPIYASFYFDDKNQRIAALQFGIVKTAEHSFEGVSQDAFDAEPSKRKPKFTQSFNDWSSLLKHFKTSIEAIAAEIKAGEASVKFNDANALSYCEVLPLLRLPERQLQFERFLDSVEPPPA